MTKRIMKFAKCDLKYTLGKFNPLYSTYETGILELLFIKTPFDFIGMKY